MTRNIARIKLIPARGVRGNSGVGVQSALGAEFMMGEGAPTLTQGFGGLWESVARPHRKSLTRYVGGDPIGQDVPVLIDGLSARRSIQTLLDGLLYWQTPQDPGFTPTVWQVRGSIHFPQKRWVIADIEFGDSIRFVNPRRAFDDLLRQEVTLKLLEYVPAGSIKVKRVPLKLTPRHLGKKKKRVVAANGRSIRKIAVKHYGTQKAAKPLGLAQKPPIRDVTRKLSKKRKIRLPRLTIP